MTEGSSESEAKLKLSCRSFTIPSKTAAKGYGISKHEYQFLTGLCLNRLPNYFETYFTTRDVSEVTFTFDTLSCELGLPKKYIEAVLQDQNGGTETGITLRNRDGRIA